MAPHGRGHHGPERFGRYSECGQVRTWAHSELTALAGPSLIKFGTREGGRAGQGRAGQGRCRERANHYNACLERGAVSPVVGRTLCTPAARVQYPG